MPKDHLVERIKEARRFVLEAIGICDLPQIEATLKQADMELHAALWNLGEIVSMRPELDYAEADSGPADPQAK